MSIRNLKRQSLIQLVLILLVIFFVNIMAGFLFRRIDLTGEKRFSLSPSTVKMAKQLKEVFYFKIYLEGDLPPGFRKLKNATHEMLDEFRVYAHDNIEYEFIDPSANPDEKNRLELFKQLNKKGLTPTNLEEREKSSRSQKIIFPGALVTYGGQEIAVQLLKNKIGSSTDEMVNNSIEALEYEFTSAIRKLSTPIANKIGFLQGQDELNTRHISDAARSLSEFYTVDTFSIHGRLDALKEYKAIIIAKPLSAFDEKDKFILDQFIMKGGRILWLIDRMQINMDSLIASGTNVAIPIDLNLDDQLFRYGVRINADLVMDLQAAPIPVVTGYVGNQPKQDLFPWFYFPLLNPTSKNPIVHNLNAIKAEFISTLDTIEADSVSKTILLTSSGFSRLQLPPARVSLNILQEEPDPKLYNKKYFPVAVLLEGIFRSNYAHRIPSEISNSPEIDFRERSVPTRMIAISDGDIIANTVTKKGTIYGLGYDRFTSQTYGNKNFILNCIDYLCDDSGTLELRAKEFKLRLLDTAKMGNQTMISWFNVLFPVLLVLSFGTIRLIRRKRKYGR